MKVNNIDISNLSAINKVAIANITAINKVVVGTSTPTTRTMLLDFKGAASTSAGATYNLLVNPSGAATFSNLFDTDLQNTGIALGVDNSFLTSDGGYPTDGTGLFNDLAFLSLWYNAATAPRVLEFQNLDNSKLYRLVFVPSRATTASYYTTFTINGVTQTILAKNNTSIIADFVDIAPTSGKITVSVGAVSGYYYINAGLISWTE